VAATRPIVFLCHASDDDDLACRIAGDLQRAGIDTFFDRWSISTGQSIRQRIDEGLGGCTHFVVLLTTASIGKPWVNAEIDGAFLRKVEGECRFLPLRHNLSIESLPPLLRAMHAPELKNYDDDILTLVGDIYGISRKPPLGERPRFTLPPVGRPSGLSIAATRVAAEIVRGSKLGRPGDPRIKVEELMEKSGLSEKDFEVAVDELERRSLVKPVRAIGCRPPGYYAVEATEYTFIELDPVFMGWKAREDAVRLATELLNREGQGLSIRDVTETIG
jgi:TIR domain